MKEEPLILVKPLNLGMILDELRRHRHPNQGDDHTDGQHVDWEGQHHI